MENVTAKVPGTPPAVEFFWAAPQEVLVVFLSGDVVAVKPLLKNTEREALFLAEEFLKSSSERAPKGKKATS